MSSTSAIIDFSISQSINNPYDHSTLCPNIQTTEKRSLSECITMDQGAARSTSVTSVDHSNEINMNALETAMTTCSEMDILHRHQRNQRNTMNEMNTMNQRNASHGVSGPIYPGRPRFSSHQATCNNGSASLQHLGRPRKRYRGDKQEPLQIHQIHASQSSNSCNGSYVNFTITPIPQQPVPSNHTNQMNNSFNPNQSVIYNPSSNVSNQWNRMNTIPIPRVPTPSVSPPDIAPNILYYVFCPMPVTMPFVNLPTNPMPNPLGNSLSHPPPNVLSNPLSNPLPATLPPLVSPSPTVSTIPSQHNHQERSSNTINNQHDTPSISYMTQINAERREHSQKVTNPVNPQSVHSIHSVAVQNMDPSSRSVAVQNSKLESKSNADRIEQNSYPPSYPPSYRPRQPEAIIPALCPKRYDSSLSCGVPEQNGNVMNTDSSCASSGTTKERLEMNVCPNTVRVSNITEANLTIIHNVGYLLCINEKNASNVFFLENV